MRCMVAAIELGPYGVPPPEAIVHTFIVDGKPRRMAFIEIPELPLTPQQLRDEAGDPEYWH